MFKGVRVSNADVAQNGFSISRTEGSQAGIFELAINGGGVVRLLFVRQPYGKVIRSFYIPWNRIVNVGEVFMDGNDKLNGTSSGIPNTA